jgi:uncharacterized protein YjiS (DUF1127 family)
MMQMLLAFLRRWRRASALASELRALDNRELNDLGIGRGRIASIAWQHAGRLIPR